MLQGLTLPYRYGTLVSNLIKKLSEQLSNSSVAVGTDCGNRLYLLLVVDWNTHLL